MALTKATIEILDEQVAVRPNFPGKLLQVQFNPTEYTLNKGAQIAEIGIYGIDSPILQFVRGQNETLSLELFFDSSEHGMGEGAIKDVRELTRPFYQLVKIQPETHAPPRIRFTWGEGLTFKAVVERVQQRFNLFNPQGIPIRATLTLSLREYRTLQEQVKELKSADHSKRRVVQRGETLSRIAAEEYRNPGMWRVIADANPLLNDPLRPPPGMILLIPPLDAYNNPVVSEMERSP
jgi:hypothetical protein